MSALTFSPPVAPDVRPSRKRMVRSKSLTQGDGYYQECGDGLNPKYDVWTLTWSDMSANEVSGYIDDFLEAIPVGGWFYWQAPRKDVVQKWKSSAVTLTPGSAGLDSISVTFTEVFNLDS